MRPVLLLIAATQCHPQSPASAQALISRYCVGCHNDNAKTANVSLSGLDVGKLAANTQTWERVLRKVRTGEMPPLNLPRPDAASTAAFTAWLESGLDLAAKAAPNPGRPSVRRLNRAEYGNAIRDLLDLDLDHASSLPADDSGFGFDNIGEVLTVSPLLMEKYMGTARRVSRLATGTVKTSAAIERYSPGKGATGDSDSLPLNTRGAVNLQRHFPVDADYSIIVRMRGNPPANAPPPKLDVRVDGRRVKLFDAEFSTLEESQGTRNLEHRMKLAAGMHEVGAAILGESHKQELGVASRRLFGVTPTAPASVESITIGGPFTPTGPGDTPSRRRVFVCRPAKGEPESACAARIIATLARRAYRRPVTTADTAPLLKIFAAGRADGGSFDHGIEAALRAILVSPSFLFRVERSVGRVTDLELATRLSFFLWSSIPDDALLRLAEANRLRPALAREVRRMLADSRSKALVDNFGGQWLHLRNVSGWRPDPDKFAAFDEPLRAAFQRETELLFGHIVGEDRSVLDFIDADYTFLNERLARHYGVPDIRGAYFRRVPVAGDQRGGGILTHGAILTVTSYPTRTSPVLRGKWILENVLGAPPPPPPPDVPDLEDKAANSAADLRAALERHRANAACASCHARLDPLGFSLENYDAIGRFRSSEGGAPVDASSALPGGKTFAGARGLRQVLMERKDHFVECLADKLLTYALGRGLEHFDQPAVREIRREAARNGYRFGALALAIANSVPFQMRSAASR
jgi:mono/diheme cytochrome c family protein